ncbi:MAG: hypothetical protein JXB62_14150 [Pirellulales bacterium]|nr:hypothetical protein [Pirellulales bacterium]
MLDELKRIGAATVDLAPKAKAVAGKRRGNGRSGVGSSREAGTTLAHARFRAALCFVSAPWPKAQGQLPAQHCALCSEKAVNCAPAATGKLNHTDLVAAATRH